MARRGRVNMFVSWCMLGVVCLAGLGCNLTINCGNIKPPVPVPTTGQETAEEEIQRTSHRFISTDGSLRPGDPGRPVAEPQGPPTQGAAPPGPIGCIDPNVSMHVGMRKTYEEFAGGPPAANYNSLPKEKEMKTHPPYIIEPPDILLIDAGRLIPKPPYVIQPLDVLIVQATKTFASEPINGTFVVGPDGMVALGFGYGAVRVGGMTLERAQAAIRLQLERALKEPQVTLGLAAFQTVQQVRGEHLVKADGTVSLGVYGCVYVAGMSLCQAQTVIEQHLSQFFLDPDISLDVFAYNSKVYYVIFDGGGYGMQVTRFPITGNETVLDAIERMGGLPAVASRRRMWVARPTPANHECVQVLPVDWLAITQSGSTRTNYQLFPGDRVYVKADPLIAFDNMLAKIISPIQRLFSVTLLGTSVFNQFRSNGGGRNGNGGGGVGFVTGF